MKKKTLLSSILTIALCLSLIAGSTLALFTDESKVSFAVTSGKVDVFASIDESSLKTYSFDTEQPAGKFENNGTAVIKDGVLNLNLMTPGDKAQVTINVDNNSNVNVQYRVVMKTEGELAPALSASANINGVDYKMNGNTTDWQFANSGESIKDITVTVEFPAVENGVLYESSDSNNQYQDKKASVHLIVEATQGNTVFLDTWEEGVADTSWYDPENPQSEYSFSSAEQLAGLSELVSGETTFKGVTFTLESDLDLYCEDTTESADGDPLTFRPIGDYSKNGTFEGTFDGNGHTISNLYQNGWDLGYEWGSYGSYGLFGSVNNATIKNLSIKGAESYIEGGDVGGICGSATGTCIFENITIEDSDFGTYNNGNGGIIGWSGAGNYTFKNITIAEDVTLAGLWGSFDSSIGGIVGQGEPGATYNFENVEINCRIDAYNDVTASYDYYNYRMCGMIIGRLQETVNINDTNYPDTSKYNITCNNVTVTYGDWMNYHYCRAEGARGIRVEAGYKYDGIGADYDHSVCTVHHMECIPFNQIFGGAQYGVKGLPSYEGVNVTYPESYNNNN